MAADTRQEILLLVGLAPSAVTSRPMARARSMIARMMALPPAPGRIALVKLLSI